MKAKKTGFVCEEKGGALFRVSGFGGEAPCAGATHRNMSLFFLSCSLGCFFNLPAKWFRTWHGFGIHAPSDFAPTEGPYSMPCCRDSVG